MSLWDAKNRVEPSEIQPKNTIEEIFLRTRAWEGLMRSDVPCDRADENGQKSEVPSSCGRKYPSNRATKTTDFGRFRMGPLSAYAGVLYNPSLPSAVDTSWANEEPEHLFGRERHTAT